MPGTQINFLFLIKILSKLLLLIVVEQILNMGARTKVKFENHMMFVYKRLSLI